MLTKNFYVVLANSFFSPKESTVFKDINGDTYPHSAPIAEQSNLPFSNMYQWKTNANNSGVVFSTDITSPSADDYKIESVLSTDSISVSSPSAITIVKTDTNIRYSATFTVHNITVENVTITKLGCICNAYVQNLSKWAYFLGDECLLDTPVIIAPDDVANITYEICVNYGDAV